MCRYETPTRVILYFFNSCHFCSAYEGVSPFMTVEYAINRSYKYYHVHYTPGNRTRIWHCDRGGYPDYGYMCLVLGLLLHCYRRVIQTTLIFVWFPAYFYIVVWETIQTSCIFVWFPAYYNIVIGEVVQTRCIVVWFPAYYNTVLGEVVQTMCIFVSVVHARWMCWQ